MGLVHQEKAMSTATLPKKPIANWEQVRDEWVAAVEQLMQEAAAWSEKQGWGALIEPKRIDEDEIGEYEVPQMLVHTRMGRVVLDPEVRFAGGSLGLVEMCRYPSYETWFITRTANGWTLRANVKDAVRVPWTEENFVSYVRQLLALKTA
jgi:hypothetical protein